MKTIVEADPVSADEYFSSTYQQARSKFLDAAHGAKAQVSNYVLPGQKGPDGSELVVDVAEIRPSEQPNVVVIISETHGVEGFCGSGCQVGFLVERVYEGLPKTVGVALVHALNPYGFAWLRRVNEDNVDLNRNFRDFTEPPPSSSAYEAVHDWLVPADWDGPARKKAEGVQGVFQHVTGVTNAVSGYAGGLIVSRKVTVGRENVAVESITSGQSEHAFSVLLELTSFVLLPDGADARIVKDILALVTLHDLKELQNVREITFDLIAGPVAANDDVFGHLSVPSVRPAEAKTIPCEHIQPRIGYRTTQIKWRLPGQAALYGVQKRLLRASVLRVREERSEPQPRKVEPDLRAHECQARNRLDEPFYEAIAQGSFRRGCPARWPRTGGSSFRSGKAFHRTSAGCPRQMGVLHP